MKQMLMDKQFMDYCGSLERIVDDEKNIFLLSDNYNTCLNPTPPSIVDEGDLDDVDDFSDVVYKYINQMLMEEDMEEKTCMFQDSAAFLAAERSFYEVIGEKYPPSPDRDQLNNFNISTQSPNSHSSCVTSSGDINSCNTSSGTSLMKEVKKMEKLGDLVKIESKYENDYDYGRSREKKNIYSDELDMEEIGRSKKQSAIFSEAIVRSEMFDMVLLCNGGKTESALREALQNGVNKNIQKNNLKKASTGAKKHGKRQQRGKAVDLRSLLTLCAQAVGGDDRRTANDLLKQIRENSSATGDGMQRLAHYFADGLEARIFGSGTQSYVPCITKPTSAAEVLRAYHLYLSVCPFRKLSNFFANRTIMNVSENATKVHIVDFGVLYGFQWPCLIQRLSSRPGGPPKLRITGIDLPNSGFRPAARVEETGQRLADYAKSFNVPFEFNAIAKKWETIKIEDLKLDRDEVLVVNCHYRLRNLLDETVVVSESPRDKVLKLIRKMKPDVYIQGVTNGSYNSPFFNARFKEALFHYSSIFDMLEANVPREVNERMLLEKQIYGWEIMNIIACEGVERIERPETYRQWQVRNVRAGFRQLPLDREIMNIARERVRSWYHKDFLIDEDGDWVLVGWKGRIIHALSSWKATY